MLEFRSLKEMITKIAKVLPSESIEVLLAGKKTGDLVAIAKLADCYWYGLKGLEKNRDYSKKLWEYLAKLNDPLGLTMCAYIICHDIQKLTPCNRLGVGIEISQRMLMENDAIFKLYEKMWSYLELAVKQNYVSWLFLYRAEEVFVYAENCSGPKGVISWSLSENTRWSFQQSYKFLDRKEKNKRNGAFRCSKSMCTSWSFDISNFQFCELCRLEKYCSSWCQIEDWNESHHELCLAKYLTGNPLVNLKNKNMDQEKCLPLWADIPDYSYGGCRTYSKHLNYSRIYHITDEINSSLHNQIHKILTEMRIKDLQHDSNEITLINLEKNAKLLINRNAWNSGFRYLTIAIDLLRNEMINNMPSPEQLSQLAKLTTMQVYCCSNSIDSVEKRKKISKLEKMQRDVRFVLRTGIFRHADIENDDIVTLQNIESTVKEKIASMCYIKAKSVHSKKKTIKKQRNVPKIHKGIIVLRADQVSTYLDDLCENSCPICLNSWGDILGNAFVVIPDCGHPICLSCIARFEVECRCTFNTDVGDGQVIFSCVLCRASFQSNMIDELISLFVHGRVHESLNVLLSMLDLSEEKRFTIIQGLMRKHLFNIEKIESALFNLVGHFTNKPLSKLTFDEKRAIYMDARAPVQSLQRDFDILHTKLQKPFEIDAKNWQELHKKQRDILLELQVARKNAAHQIYERMNSVITMGVPVNVTSLKQKKLKKKHSENRDVGSEVTYIDLHGLHINEAIEIVDDFVIPVLPVLRTINLITGHGLHSNDGVSTLKKYISQYFKAKGFSCNELDENVGVLHIQI
ncbi:hypothetical protein HK096_007279 [Nowakowskiella sp. JEL0078]|nr:hypothetical protein HK096_007279 [Nowakowskiella sp. JEL0078]